MQTVSERRSRVVGCSSAAPRPHMCSPFDFLYLGPLLPENLDVRCIPVSQVRNLTIDLSGECFFQVDNELCESNQGRMIL